MKNKNLVFVLIIVGIVILAVIFMSVTKKESKTEREPLTEADFEILSVGWDDYVMEWNSLGEYVRRTPNEEINWESQCEYCKTGKWSTDGEDYSFVNKEERCTSMGSHITLRTSRNLNYNYAIDGEGVEKLTEKNRESFVLNEGISLHGISYNFNIEKDHELIYCAKENFYDYDIKGFNEEFICDSVTLPAKCPLN